MRKFSITLIVLLVAALGPVPGGAAATTLVHVDNGDFFYDLDDDCIGDTDDPAGAEALRHWHVGLPFLGAEAEVAAGFGCLGGPASWEIEVQDGWTATVEGSIRFTWDQNVPGGGLNDMQLHIFDGAGDLVESTVFDGNPALQVPGEIFERTFSFTLAPGDYSIVEDVFFGEHTAWLTTMTVTAVTDDPGPTI